MLIVILLLQILTLLGLLGVIGAVVGSDPKPRKQNHLAGTFLDDDMPGYIETPLKKPRKKQAVKKTTTLKKGASAKIQKRAANGRFA